MGESVATDAGFKVYFSGRMKGSYALIVVAHCSGVDGVDFLEYHVCVSSVCGSSVSGNVDREEIFESELGADGTSLSLAEFGKVAADIALWRVLLERRSVTKDQSPLGPSFPDPLHRPVKAHPGRNREPCGA